MWSTQSQEIYNLLDNEMVRTTLKWHFFKKYFAESSNRVEILNQIAPVTFAIFQSVLLDDVILSINRMLDRADMGQNKNLVFERLVSSIKSDELNELASRLDEKLECINNSAQNLRIKRNRRISHNDLSTLQSVEEILPGITVELINNVITSMIDFLNEASASFTDVEKSYMFLDWGGQEPERFFRKLSTLID